MGFWSTAEAVLKNPRRLLVLEESRAEDRRTIQRLLILCVLCLAVFGLLLGGFSGGQQLWVAPTKVALGALFSLLICLPSLFIFGSLAGMNVRVEQVVKLGLSGLTLTSLLLVGFAPVVWVFSQSSDSLVFMGGLAVVFWMVSVLFGMRLVRQEAELLKLRELSYLNLWIFIFILVTLQVSTAVRPIIGTADTFFPKEKRFFMQHWGEEMDTPAPTPAVRKK
ncbi:MAG: hypothetical protein KDK99_12930 [Verrucomicrobiales bacterium]|nr:hypothetical protein [Verrucomicrobiales bacterium]